MTTTNPIETDRYHGYTPNVRLYPLDAPTHVEKGTPIATIAVKFTPEQALHTAALLIEAVAQGGTEISLTGFYRDQEFVQVTSRRPAEVTS